MTSRELRTRFDDINGRIRRAAESVHRDPASVTLVAVTKTVPTEFIEMAVDLGHRDFGESRWQEAEPKIASLPSGIVWHFIGVLQSNKAKKIAQHFRVIHTLDKASQLPEIAKAGTVPEGLIEVNVAMEEQKSGVSPETLDALHRNLLESPGVKFRGLMTIGPPRDNPEEIRPVFRQLRELNERLGGQWLSMGMSDNFEVAIQEGSTHIRVGSALFGARSAR